VIVIFNMAPKEEETEDIFTQADLEGMERKELQLYANLRCRLLASSTASKPYRDTGIALGITLSLLETRPPDAAIFRLTVPALEAGAQRAP